MNWRFVILNEVVSPGTREVFVILNEVKNLGRNGSEHSPTKILHFVQNDKSVRKRLC